MSFLLTSDRMLIQYLLFYPEFKPIKIIRTQNSEIECKAIEEITDVSINLMKELNFDKKFI